MKLCFSLRVSLPGDAASWRCHCSLVNATQCHWIHTLRALQRSSSKRVTHLLTRSRPFRGHAAAELISCAMGAAGGPAYECHLCGAAATQSCGACGALFYCGEAHRALHWADGGHGGAECVRLAADVAAGAELRAALPFPWAAAATEALEAQRDTACGFLTRAGVHGVGLWRRECACGAAGPFGACPSCCGSLLRRRSRPRAGTLPPRDRAATRDELWALPPGHAPGDGDGQSGDAGDADAPQQPHDWESYYARRRVPPAHATAVTRLNSALVRSSAPGACPWSRLLQCVLMLL